MSDSGQRFIKRNRPPRVHITYQDPYDTEKLIELPFVMGVLADLSGNNAGVEKSDVAKRDFIDIDMDNFERRMSEGIKPGVSLRVADKLTGDPDKKQQLQVNLRFNKMDDFKPAGVANQVPALKKLLDARDQLKNLQLYMNGKANAEAKLQELLGDPDLMRLLRERSVSKTPDDSSQDK